MEWNLKQRKRAVGILLLGVGVLAVTTMVMATGGGMGGPGGGGGGQTGSQNMNEKAASVITVKLALPSIGSLQRDTEFIGKIEAADTVSVYPQASGKIEHLYYEEGDYVESGALLMELDTTDLEFEMEKAVASYESTVASANKTLGSDYTSKIISAETSIEKAEESYRKARLNYKSEINSEDDNIDSLMEKMDTSEAKMDDLLDEYNHLKSDSTADSDDVSTAYEAYLTARSDYNNYADQYSEALDGYDDLKSSVATDKNNSYKDLLQAQQQMELTTGDAYTDQKAVIEAQLKSAQLSLESAQRSLDKTQVYAPVGGKIMTRDAEEFGTASTNTAAFTIQNDVAVQLAFNATADGADALRIGDQVTVTRSSNTYQATISEIKTEADDTTGLFPIKARLEDGSELLPGVTVKVSAATAKAENVLLVPIDNVYYDADTPYIFAYEDGKAVRKDLVTGMSDADTVVVEDGILTSSLIITTWHPDLKDGASVVLAEGQEDILSQAQNAPEMPVKSATSNSVEKVDSIESKKNEDDNEEELTSQENEETASLLYSESTNVEDDFGAELPQAPEYPDTPRTTDLSPAYVGKASDASSRIAQQVIKEANGAGVLNKNN